MTDSDKEHCRITVKGKTKMEDVKHSILSTDSVNACLRVRSLQRDNDGRRAVEADNDENKGSVRVVSGSGFRYVVPFPWRLHQMLEDIEKSGGDSIVSWLPDGHHFQVHNPQLFMQRIIPKFFKQKSYKSFQRQLHLYGFHRVLEGQNRGAYYHENFVRENRKLALEITRIKAPKRRRVNKLTSAKVKGDEKSIDVGPVCMDNPAPFLIQDVTRSRPGTEIICPCPEGIGDGICKVHSSESILRSNPATSYSTPQADLTMSANPRCLPSISTSQEVPRETSVADTYEWLINAGVPFSAFDPIAIETTRRSSDLFKKGMVSDLIDCADEITSLFSSPCHKTPACQKFTSSVSDVPVCGKGGAFVSVGAVAHGSIHFARKHA